MKEHKRIKGRTEYREKLESEASSIPSIWFKAPADDVRKKNHSSTLFVEARAKQREENPEVKAFYDFRFNQTG